MRLHTSYIIRKKTACKAPILSVIEGKVGQKKMTPTL